MEIRTFQQADTSAVVQLWRDCGLVVAHNDPEKDIRRKLAVHPELFLVGVDKGRIVATVMAGYEGHRGWLNYLAVAPDCRRKGQGRQMVRTAEQRLRALGCPKINIQVRSTNVDVVQFYEKIGFEEDKVVSLGKRLEQD